MKNVWPTCGQQRLSIKAESIVECVTHIFEIVPTYTTRNAAKNMKNVNSY